VLVAEAAYDDRSGLPTSFLVRAERAASGAALQNLLVNASRIDWQVRDGGRGQADVVAGVWAALRERLLSGSFEEQLSLLTVVRRGAYFQPDLALELVDEILGDDSDDSTAAGHVERPWAASRADVVHATVPVLQNVAYRFESLPPALDRLWALAQDDQRPPNQHPEHPLRVLRGIADLRTGKPFAYIHAVIDAAASWLTMPSRLSPFDVIEAVLATEGSDEVSSGMKLTFYSFGIDPASVRPVRQRVVDLAFTQATSADLPSAVRAIKALEHAISGPIGMFSRQVTDDERESWAAEFVPIIARLGWLGADPDRDPAIRMAIREALGWHADHSTTATKDAAQAALDAMVTTVEDDLAACLHAGWDTAVMRDGLSFEEAERAQREEFRRVAAAICGGRDDHEVLDRLENRLRIERLASEKVDRAGRFISELLIGRPSAAALLCTRVLAGDLPELTAFTATALGVLVNRGDADAIDLASSMLATEDTKLQWEAASGLSWNRAGRTSLLPGEGAVLAVMAVHSNDFVRAMAGRAAFVIGLSDTATALDLLSKIEFRGSPQVAAGALTGFMLQGPLNWSGTTTALRTSILNQLLDLGSINKYEIKAALSELSLIDPLRVTRLLMKRVDRQTSLQSLDYEALPYRWDPPLRIQQTTELSRCLSEVRDWATHRGLDRRRYPLQDAAADLYQIVAGDWNDQALATLANLGDAPTEAALVTAARLLAHAPATTLFAQVPLVTTLLHQAESLGKDSAELVVRALLTTPGVITRWVGAPTDNEEQELEQAHRITENLPRGSIERHFFEHLANRIEERLSWAVDPSLPRDDGREW
jgi:hypothetical protein